MVPGSPTSPTTTPPPTVPPSPPPLGGSPPPPCPPCPSAPPCPHLLPVLPLEVQPCLDVPTGLLEGFSLRHLRRVMGADPHHVGAEEDEGVGAELRTAAPSAVPPGPPPTSIPCTPKPPTPQPPPPSVPQILGPVGRGLRGVKDREWRGHREWGTQWGGMWGTWRWGEPLSQPPPTPRLGTTSSAPCTPKPGVHVGGLRGGQGWGWGHPMWGDRG